LRAEATSKIAPDGADSGEEVVDVGEGGVVHSCLREEVRGKREEFLPLHSSL
jgi:hypothetical protein